jgi:alpha-L-arabinofuranosidase
VLAATCLVHALAPLGLAAALCATAPAAPPELVSFRFDQGPIDEAGAPAGWQIAVYGAQPTVTLDAPAPGRDGRSLRISASEDSDTAIYQDLQVVPNAWYRLSGWVKTEDLRAATSIYGAFCAADGPSPYVCSPNRGGDSEWQREAIVLRAPASGTLRVALFLVGFGKGTGTVWFTDLALESVSASEAASASIVVTKEAASPAPISPWIYGNFIEFLDHHVQGMRAQMLDDVSFEGILPPAEWCFWQPDKDVVDRPWHETGLGGDGRVERIREGAFNGESCYRISIPTAPGYGHGIRQRGLCVRPERTYTLSLYLRQEDCDGPVEVNLGHDWGPFVSSYAKAAITGVTGEWAKYTVTLAPDTEDTDAELSIRVAATGTVWVDQVTLVPDDSILGWRRDVVEATRALKPNCLRFGGSAVIVYDWTKGIGDPDKRVPFPNQYWGRMEPNDVGIGEFLQFCDLVDAEPIVCVSYNVGAPEDAASQVEYCNGGVETKWGALRAANGHPEPYGVRLWQVGNEQSGPEYEAKLPSYCKAMLAVDPGIELLTAFPSDKVVEDTRDLARYICPHYYTPSLRDVLRDLAEQRARLDRLAPGKAIRVGVTEWNGSAGDWGAARAFQSTQSNALYGARLMHIFQRNSDLVAMANRSGLMNGWCCGNIQTSARGLWVTPAYYAMQLLSTHCGSHPLRVADEHGRELRGADSGTVLDVAATASDDGKLTVTVVNDGPDAVESTLDLRAHLRSNAGAKVYTLAADGPWATNGEASPDRVRPAETATRVEPEQRLSFPAWSLTVLVVEP